MVKGTIQYNTDTQNDWSLNTILVLSILSSLVVFMGLKLKWFRARMSFKGSSSNTEKYNTVTGIGFKQSSELLPTYKSISTEFSTPVISTPRPHGQYQKTTKREPNPEIALKIRSILSRSLSNVNERENYKPILNSSKSNDDISIRDNIYETNNNNYRQSDTIVDYEKRKKQLMNDCDSTEESEIVQDTVVVKPKPRSILKKTNVDPEINNIETINQNGNVEQVDSLYKKNPELTNGVIENKQNLVPPRKPSNISVQSNVSSEPPPVNYSTLPRNRESIAKEWDQMISPSGSDENLSNPDPFYESVVRDQDDQAYVIQIEEPNNNNLTVDNDQEMTYAEIDKNNKKKKVISFEDNVTEINDKDSDGPDRKRLSSVSTGSVQSEEYNSDSDNFYGNDYTNSKRTSYFQAGGATFSSQAASIFITNKKPISVNERRPTAFVPNREATESDTEA